MSSELRGTSSATRTLDAKQLAALRPATATPRRPRNPRPEPLGRSQTYFCSNPQCDHATLSDQDQARHMAREFWTVAQALIRLAPDSPEALKLTGGVIMAELADDECRTAHLDYQRAIRQNAIEELPIDTRIRYTEYNRRVRAGTLGPRLVNGIPLPGKTRRPQEMCRKGLHPLSGDNLGLRPDGHRYCRECASDAQRKYTKRPYVRARMRAAQKLRRQRLKEQPASTEGSNRGTASAGTRQSA